jgi:hypothetical protein
VSEIGHCYFKIPPVCGCSSRRVGRSDSTRVYSSGGRRIRGYKAACMSCLLIIRTSIIIGDVFHTTCAGAPTRPFEFPSESNAAEIAARLNAAVLVGGEMPDFFTQKIKNVNGGTAPAGCPADGLDNKFVVPRASPCVGVIRGGTRTAAISLQSPGVKITTIPAFHAAGASRIHIDEPNVPVELTGYAGHETGYILRFTNGLTVL